MKNYFLIFCLISISHILWSQKNYYDGTITVENFKNDVSFKELIQPGDIDYVRLNACVYYATNEQRVKNGLEVVPYYQPLEVASWYHSKSMTENNYFGHGNDLDPKRKGPSDRVRLAGIKNPYAAENCAAMYSGGRTYLNVGLALVEMWMNSKGHRANILSKENKQMGCGVFINPFDFKTNATQVFQWFYMSEFDESTIVDKFSLIEESGKYTYEIKERYKKEKGGFFVKMDVDGKEQWQERKEDNSISFTFKEIRKDNDYVILQKSGTNMLVRVPINSGWTGFTYEGKEDQWNNQQLVFKVPDNAKDIDLKESIVEVYKAENGKGLRRVKKVNLFTWEEFKPDGSTSFTFSEKSRDDQYIILLKTGTNMLLRVPVNGGMVSFAYEGPTQNWGGIFSVKKITNNKASNTQVDLTEKLIEIYQYANGGRVVLIDKGGFRFWEEQGADGKKGSRFKEIKRDYDFIIIQKNGTNMYLRIPTQDGWVGVAYDNPDNNYGNLIQSKKVK